jgi:hypothetical protein
VNRHLWFPAIFACLAFIPPVYGDEEYDQLMREYQASLNKWYERLSETESDMESMLSSYPSHSFIPRFRAYALKHTAETEAIPALIWLAGEGGKGTPAEAFQAAPNWALEELTKHHAQDPSMGKHITRLLFLSLKGFLTSNEKLKAFYMEVMEKNKNEEALSWATYGLAFEIYHEETDRDEVRSANKDKALELFRLTVRKYSGTNAALGAACFVYELENLQIGMKAPEITGVDVDGREIRLSRFLGRVVVIDFWGFW